MALPEIEFYDVKTKSKFKTTNYVLVEKSGRMFVVSKAAAGHECWKVIGKADVEKVKKAGAKLEKR
ncbi:MAG: hypothetical protein ACOYT4_03200 [Nanoarchaeota archaeon]